MKELDESGHSVLVSRAKSPLERLNRKLRERTPRHPTAQALADSLKPKCNEYVDMVKDTKFKRHKGHKHLPVPVQTSLLTLLFSRLPSKGRALFKTCSTSYSTELANFMSHFPSYLYSAVLDVVRVYLCSTKGQEEAFQHFTLSESSKCTLMSSRGSEARTTRVL